MHRFRFVLSIAVIVAATGTVRAGIYCSLDQFPYPAPTSFGKLNSALAGVRSPRNLEKDQDMDRKTYLARAKALEVKEKDGSITLDEQIDLSGVYLRLENRSQDAIRVLRAADQNHFLVLTHLATAYHQLDQLETLDRAIYYQQQALKAWPVVSLRWKREQLAWYRRAEQYYLELLRLRRQDLLAGKQTYDSVYALFPKARFETPEGVYEVGGPTKLSERPAEDLPQDAVQIVAQLLCWLPFDNRLSWLYGELLNQRGEVLDAYKVLNELVVTRKLQASIRPMYRHYQELEEASKSLATIWEYRRQLLFLYRPHVGFAPPGVGELALDGGAVVATAAALAADKDPLIWGTGKRFDPPEVTPTPPVSPPSRTWLPDWRTAAVSFAAGMLFMGLLLLQWREWSRRRAPVQAAQRSLTG